MLSRSSFWVLVLILIGVGVAGPILIPPPQPDNVEIQVLEQFYGGQRIWAVGVGVFVGLLMGVLATQGVLHKPGERAADYDGRVVVRGFWSGSLAAVVSIIVMTLGAVITSIEPLSPIQKAEMTVFSGEGATVFCLASAVALITYSGCIRLRTWGGQYSIVPRG
jgi:hypothetical protein